MENKEKKSVETIVNRITKRIAFLFFSMVFFAYNAMAQDGGPSLGNLNKNLTAAKDQMSYQEKVNYVFMAVGFALVLAIAWFSTSLAKKRKLEADEARRRHHANHQVKHSPHDPYFQRHGAHK